MRLGQIGLVILVLAQLWGLSFAQTEAGELREVRFDVWPPEAQVLVVIPGRQDSRQVLGSAQDTLKVYRGTHFSSQRGEARFLFQAEGYKSATKQVDWKRLEDLSSSNGLYPESITLEPESTLGFLTDALRRHPGVSGLTSLLVLAGLAGGLSTYRRKRYAQLHREFGGDGNLTEFADYILLKAIGEGATAQTFLCCDRTAFYKLPWLGPATAPETKVLKKLTTNFQSDQSQESSEFEARFKREVKSLKSCNHHNIVQIEDHDIDRITHTAYIVMERAKGAPLDHYIERGEKRALDEVVQIAKQLCAGLQHMHDAGLVHRDIKPPNIILSEDNVLKIVDLGIAKSAQARTKITQGGAYVGSPPYSPMEQMQGKEPHRDFDLYATAMCLYEQLTGVIPLQPSKSCPNADVITLALMGQYRPLAENRPDLPEALDELFKRVIRGGSSKPPESMTEFLEEFLAAAQE